MKILKVKGFIVFMLLSSFVSVMAGAKGDALDLVEDALKLIKNRKDYRKAEITFSKAYKLFPDFGDKAKVIYGNTLFFLHKNKEAFLIYKEIQNENLTSEANYNIGQLHLLKGEYSDAIGYYQVAIDNGGRFASKASYGKNTCLWGLKNHVIGNSTLLKTEIPTYGQFAGVSYKDENHIIYSFLPPGGKHKTVAVSEFDGETLGIPKPLSKLFSQVPFDVGAVSLTRSRPKILFFTATTKYTDSDYRAKTILQVFSTELINKKWTRPKSFPFNSDKVKTTHSVGQPSVSKKGKIIFFASNIKGGVGGIDIYLSRKKGSSWGTPKLLDFINTKGNEFYPYYDEENNRLFFSSNGIFGYGGYDMFYVDLDKKGNPISKPINLKRPLNSAGDDFGLVLNPNNPRKGLMASNREDGSVDIVYAVKLAKIPDDNKINIVEVVMEKNVSEERKDIIIDNSLNKIDFSLPKFLISDKINLGINKLDTFSIEYKKTKILSDTKMLEPKFISNLKFKEDTSDFIVDLILELRDLKIVSKKSPRVKKKRRVVSRSLKRIVKKKVKKRLLAKLYFRKKTLVLNSGAAVVLKKISAILKKDKSKRLKLIGYTDTFGQKSYNREVAWFRVVKIKNYLVYNYQVDPFRISIFGYGEGDYLNGLLSSLVSEKVHATYRRVDIYIE